MIKLYIKKKRISNRKREMRASKRNRKRERGRERSKRERIRMSQRGREREGERLLHLQDERLNIPIIIIKKTEISNSE